MTAQAAIRDLVGKPPASAPRTEIASAVKDRLVALATQNGYIARTFRFADDLAPLADGNPLEGRGVATGIGDALRAALAAHRGRYVTDVVIVSAAE